MKNYSFLIAAVALSLWNCSSNDTDDKGELRISEIYYNSIPGDSLEFIELYNGTDKSIDLSFAQIKGGVSYTFGADIEALAPGKYLVITNSPELFAARFPTVAAFGPWSGKLTSEGEDIEVEDADGKSIAEAEFGSEWPWPALANGAGYSLVDIGGNPTQPSSWQCGNVFGGNPGAKDASVTALTVLINEVLPATDSTEGFIELYNAGSKSVDISGWRLADSPDDTTVFTLPAGSQLASGAFLNLPSSLWNSLLHPSTTGDQLVLAEISNGSLTGRSSSLDFPALNTGESAGWISNEETQIEIFSTPTPNASNGIYSPGSIVISEIHYHPDGENAEFLEVWNTSADKIELSSLLAPTRSWIIAGIDLILPIPFAVDAGQKLVLIQNDDLDSAVFRSRYKVPASSPILYYEGKLSNSGEQIAIQQPLIEVVDNEGLLSYAFTWSDVVSYGEDSPWPSDADGNGKSLTRIHFDIAGSDPSAWKAQSPTPGY